MPPTPPFIHIRPMQANDKIFPINLSQIDHKMNRSLLTRVVLCCIETEKRRTNERKFNRPSNFKGFFFFHSCRLMNLETHLCFLNWIGRSSTFSSRRPGKRSRRAVQECKQVNSTAESSRVIWRPTRFKAELLKAFVEERMKDLNKFNSTQLRPAKTRSQIKCW